MSRRSTLKGEWKGNTFVHSKMRTRYIKIYVDMRTAMDLITPRGSRDLMSSQTGTREHTTLSVG